MQYDACVVPGISWSVGKRVSFYRFIASLSFYRYRYRYTQIVSVRYFLSYRFQTIIPKRSVRYPPQMFISSVFSTPFLIFSCPLFWLSLYSFCSNLTIHIQTGVHSPMLSGVGNDTHQTTSQSGPSAVGVEGHFLPCIYSEYYFVFLEGICLFPILVSLHAVTVSWLVGSVFTKRSMEANNKQGGKQISTYQSQTLYT